MSADSVHPHATRSPLLERLGETVRAQRQSRGWSRVELATASGLSVRFLADLEAGSGNISVGRLADVARALGTAPSALLARAEGPVAGDRSDDPGVVALLGLRGAGKSTLGPVLALRLGVPFVELDQLVEQASGIPLGQLFELHGERYFRRLERETLARFLVENRRAVLATGGGIVTEPETFDLLRRNTRTVWLKAHPRQHWDRVVAQGDRRPMANRAQAMDELEELLRARAPLYSQADIEVDTARLGVDAAAGRIASALAAVRG